MLINSTQVPNSLLDAIFVANSEFTEQEKDLLLFICRKTIGWQKETQWLSLSYIEGALSRDKANISRSLHSLLDKKAITLETESGKHFYGLSVERWGLSNKQRGVVQQTTEGLSNKQPIKQTIIKQTIKETGTRYIFEKKTGSFSEKYGVTLKEFSEMKPKDQKNLIRARA